MDNRYNPTLHMTQTVGQLPLFYLCCLFLSQALYIPFTYATLNSQNHYSTNHIIIPLFTKLGNKRKKTLRISMKLVHLCIRFTQLIQRQPKSRLGE